MPTGVYPLHTVQLGPGAVWRSSTWAPVRTPAAASVRLARLNATLGLLALLHQAGLAVPPGGVIYKVDSSLSTFGELRRDGGSGLAGDLEVHLRQRGVRGAVANVLERHVGQGLGRGNPRQESDSCGQRRPAAAADTTSPTVVARPAVHRAIAGTPLPV